MLGKKHSDVTKRRIQRAMNDYWAEHKEERMDKLIESARRLNEDYKVWLSNGNRPKSGKQQSKNTIST